MCCWVHNGSSPCFPQIKQKFQCAVDVMKCNVVTSWTSKCTRGRSLTSQCQASVCLCLGMVGIHIPQKQATWAANSDKISLVSEGTENLFASSTQKNVAVFHNHHNHHTVICKIAFILSEPPGLEQNIIFFYCRARYPRKKRGSIILYFPKKN